MQAIQTQDLPLMHFNHRDDASGRCDAAWPIYRDTGAAATAVVYFALEPGAHLGTHTDSAEEVWVVLEGEVEAVVGDERRRLRAGGIGVAPALVPHDVINAGQGVAKVAGVLAGNTIVSVFDEGFEQTDGSRVVGTPMPAEAATPA